MSIPGTSLLERLRQDGEQSAWERLVDIYTPLLYFWSCRAGLQGEDAATLVREVLAEAARKLPTLQTFPPGGFRAWLRALAHAQRGKLLQKRAVAVGPAGAPPAKVSPPSTGAEALWQGEYISFVLGPALDLLQTEFAATEWKAFWGLTVEGRPAAEVAREVGVSSAAVYIAEGKVMRRLRQELAGLID